MLETDPVALVMPVMLFVELVEEVFPLFRAANERLTHTRFVQPYGSEVDVDEVEVTELPVLVVLVILFNVVEVPLVEEVPVPVSVTICHVVSQTVVHSLSPTLEVVVAEDVVIMSLILGNSLPKTLNDKLTHSRSVQSYGRDDVKLDVLGDVVEGADVIEAPEEDDEEDD